MHRARHAARSPTDEAPPPPPRHRGVLQESRGVPAAVPGEVRGADGARDRERPGRDVPGAGSPLRQAPRRQGEPAPNLPRPARISAVALSEAARSFSFLRRLWVRSRRGASAILVFFLYLEQSSFVKLSGLNKTAYQSSVKALECLLGVNARLGMRELAVQLCCTEALSAASEILQR